MGSLDQMLKYLGERDDEHAQAVVAAKKWQRGKAAMPSLLRELREDQTTQLMTKLGKNRDMLAKAREQQAEQGRSPEVAMDPIQIRSGSVAPGIASEVASGAFNAIAGGPQPAASGTTAGPMLTGPSPSGPGGTFGPGGPTSRQVITETGDQQAGWAQQNYGSPALNILARIAGAVSGKGGPTQGPATQRTVDTYEPPPSISPYQAAQLEIQRKTASANIMSTMVSQFPASKLPAAFAAVNEATATGSVSAQTAAPLGESFDEKKLKAAQGDYADRASYRQQRLDQEQAKADAKVGAEGAKKRSADLTAISVGEDIQRKSRERAVAEGRFDGFNLASAMAPDVTPAAFTGNTLDKIGDTIRGANTSASLQYGRGRSPSDLQDGEINELSLRAANLNQVLVKTGKGDDFQLSLIPYSDWMKLDQTARGNDPRRTPKEQDAAREVLQSYGLLNKDPNDKELGPTAKGNFASASRRLWETGDKLVNTPAWRQVMGAEFSGPGRLGVPGVGKTQAELLAEKAKFDAEQKRIQELSGAVFNIPEARSSLGQ